MDVAKRSSSLSSESPWKDGVVMASSKGKLNKVHLSEQIVTVGAMKQGPAATAKVELTRQKTSAFGFLAILCKQGDARSRVAA